MAARERGEQASVVGRRALIKRATAAGAVAWTAPILIDSLTSPAAAVSAPLGGNSFTIGTDTTSCRPAGYPAANSLPAACITPTTYTGGGPVTFSVTGGCSCAFTAAQAVRAEGGQCVPPALLGATSVTFGALNGNQSYAGFKFVLTCG